MFIAVEGPNGVGKTTIATRLAHRLANHDGVRVHLTTEPSRTPLGALLRASEAVLSGRSLALAIAADRYAHIDDEIIPELDAGCHVITDRYVQSSLVLQRVDAVDLAEIWSYNRYVLPPTLSLYLEDHPEVIAARLANRTHLSRLEATGGPRRELALYREAYTFLARRSWRQHRLDCHERDPDQVVDLILTQLSALAHRAA